MTTMKPETLKSVCVQLAKLYRERDQESRKLSIFAGIGGGERTPEQAEHRANSHRARSIAYGYAVAFNCIYTLLGSVADAQDEVDERLEKEGLDTPSCEVPMPNVKWNLYGY